VVKDVCRLDAWFEVASSVVTGLKVLEQRGIGAEISGVANIREDERCVALTVIRGPRWHQKAKRELSARRAKITRPHSDRDPEIGHCNFFFAEPDLPAHRQSHPTTDIRHDASSMGLHRLRTDIIPIRWLGAVGTDCAGRA
jgi:hypothetical protein